MDMSEKGKCSSEKNEGHQNYNKAGVSSEWQFSNAEVGFVRYQTCSTPCPSVSMGDSFNPSLWSISTSSTNLGLCANDNPAISKAVPGTSLLGVCWNPSDSLSRGGNFLQSGPGILPPSLSHFPADSAFVERAARLSCFNATGLGSMANPFSTSHSLSPYSNASRGVADARIQKIDINMTESLRDIASLPANHGSCDKSPMTEQKKGSMHDIESDEVDFSGNCHDNAVDLASAAEDSSSKNLGAKKRKRPNEDAAKDQTRGDPQISSETETKKNSLTAAAVKPNGKQSKNVSESPKEDYIHVRARHGQATNSHSLAERVRREKISQRMKFLQELVPGCSKVTGKAVMLDEIINYVQSLQQQVEFLSMKLAAVNPRLDSNIETLLSKDFLQSHGAPSSAIGFSSDMVNPQRHLSQQGLVQTGISGNLNSPNAFGRAINSQLNLYKGPTTQMFNTWDEELQNVMKMATFSNNPLNSQEFNDKSRDGFHL